MNLDQNISNQMIEALPIGVYVVDSSMEISYYNQAFANIFSPGVHKTKPYFGHLVSCGYCQEGQPDPESVSCSNCLIIRQHNQAFQTGHATEVQDVVQEFHIQGERKLMYIQIQSIPLNNELLMVLIKDLTEEAEKLIQAED